MRGRGRFLLAFVAGGLAVIVAVVIVVVAVVLPEVQKVQSKVVRFQQAAQLGPHPFTSPAEAKTAAAALQAAGGGGGGSPSGGGGGGASAGGGGGGTPSSPSGGSIEKGTFGGSGSNQVCDREKLIKLLLANPDRLRAWANALGIDATPKAVADYIRKLRPVTLTRDTQVTNHSFLDGDAQPYQAILQKGTAVLVDQTGKPVTRCRCGNPLSEPVKLSGTVKCIDCPPAYRPPPPCNYTDEKGDCYAKQPEAPPVKGEEKPSDTTDCEHDPSSPGCADKCKQDPSLPFCDHENQNQSQEQQAPQGGQGTTSGGEQAPSQGGGTPPESGGTPSEGGGGAGGP